MGRIFRFGSPVQEQDMQIVGMPETFWIVTTPTANSELGDCCFLCDFRKFALQIRGGLEIEEIVGIYADEQVATATATKLLEARCDQPDPDTVTHSSPWPDWIATQKDRRSVWICDKASNETIEVKPPVEWGNAWAWNINEQGTGVVLRRVL